MGASYTLHEDQHVKIDANEGSCRFDLSIDFKSGGEFPFAVVELFNDKNIEAAELAALGFRALSAALLFMDDADVRRIKQAVQALLNLRGEAEC